MVVHIRTFLQAPLADISVSAMRRAVALALIAALVSVSSLPLLPEEVVCAFASERMADCAACHDDASMAKGMQHGMAMGKDHRHGAKLSTAEQHCRIECGCGCHRDLDGMPHQLAPHAVAMTAIMAERHVQFAPTASLFPIIPAFIAVNTPPPKAFS